MPEIHQCYNKVQAITEILFLLPHFLKTTRKNIVASQKVIFIVLYFPFNFTVLLENSYLLKYHDNDVYKHFKTK